jgi:DNA-binding PadR family transcriptional regulator
VPKPIFLGEFEQVVLLALLDVGAPEGDAPVRLLRRRLDELARRPVGRGALYRTLDRLEEKGWVQWSLDEADVPERGGHPARRFRVTPEGVSVLRASRDTLRDLWSRVGEVMG